MLGWLVPAITAIGGGIAGAIKNKSDMKQYVTDMDKDKKGRQFAAFTGYQGRDFEKPSAGRSIMGGAIGGAKMGMGAMSGIGGMQAMNQMGDIREIYKQLLQKQLGGGMGGMSSGGQPGLGVDYNSYFNNASQFNPFVR